MASKTIVSSKILPEKEKPLSLALIWFLPLLGIVLSTNRLSRQTKKNQQRTEKKMVNALNRLTKNFKSMNDEIKQQHNNKVDKDKS